MVCDTGASVIRLKLHGGGVHIVDTDPSEWTFMPGRQDVAAILLRVPHEVLSEIEMVTTDMFIIDENDCDAHVGDDVFMVGRFIDYDGRETNMPATRFGTISMMDAPIKQPTRFRGRSIIVDMHSRTGFSWYNDRTSLLFFRAGSPDSAWAQSILSEMGGRERCRGDASGITMGPVPRTVGNSGRGREACRRSLIDYRRGICERFQRYVLHRAR